uniref:Spliced glycoprotein U85.5 n=1 Tax=Schistocephalus solidus TaxID=70667 RepID=A0A183SC09_SCHSO
LRLLREELRRRPPPPTYSEALDNSLFEEPILEFAVVNPSGPPPIPLSITGLTRAQVESVRQRSMKPSNRVDVACSCDLSSLSGEVPCVNRRGDEQHQEHEGEDDSDEGEEAGDTDNSSDEDDEEEEVVNGGHLPTQLTVARGEPDPTDPPRISGASHPPVTTASSAYSRGGGRLWQWMSRLRFLGGAYQPIQAVAAAGGGASAPAVATTEARGSESAIIADTGGDFARRHSLHSVHSDEVDTGTYH